MKKILGYSVFWRSLGVTFVSLVLVILLMAVVYLVSWFSESRQTDARLESQMALMQQAFAEGGITSLRKTLEHDSELWHEDYLHDVLDEDKLIIRVVVRPDQTLIGFAGIDPAPGRSNTYVEHEDLQHHHVDTLRQSVNQETDIIVGRFFPESLFVLLELLGLVSIVLVAALVPLGLLTGYLLAAFVGKRVNGIEAVIRQVSGGNFDTRVTVDDANDEFSNLARTTNDMLDRVATLRRNLQGVSHGVAHDIKTPVSNIAGRLQLIERDLAAPAAIKNHLQEADRHIDYLRRTLDALLRLGEVEAGVRNKSFKPTDLSSLCTEMIESFTPVFEDADKSLEASIERNLFIDGDRDLLTQMLINLLENIIEHARDGASGWLRLTNRQEQVVLEIGDDGPGIPPNLNTRVFERFYQMDSSRQTTGNGLGLSLVKAIVDQHGGQIQLRPGLQGAVFELCFNQTISAKPSR